MKIGIIGATGQEGSLLMEEAVSRGHDVTAIVRDTTGLKDQDIKIIHKDLFELTASDLKDFDVVISAFGVTEEEGLEYQYVTTTMTLTSIMETLPEVRLMISGGGASLYEDASMSRRLIDHLDDVPGGSEGIPYYAYLGFEMLKKSTCQWTYFSPARVFDVKGPRTGNYVLGTDYMIQNNQGESYLTYADGAAAIIDEAERGSFIRKRFTAVSNVAVSNESIQPESSGRLKHDKPDALKKEDKKEAAENKSRSGNVIEGSGIDKGRVKKRFFSFLKRKR